MKFIVFENSKPNRISQHDSRPAYAEGATALAIRISLKKEPNFGVSSRTPHSTRFERVDRRWPLSFEELSCVLEVLS